jgi:hypothetical protein
MTETSKRSPPPPECLPGASESLCGHIAENIESIAAFQLREQHKLGDSHRRLGSVGDLLGRPGYLLSLLSLIVFWIAVNALSPRRGWWPLDPPPFAWLQGFRRLLACSRQRSSSLRKISNWARHPARASRAAIEPTDRTEGYQVDPLVNRTEGYQVDPLVRRIEARLTDGRG